MAGRGFGKTRAGAEWVRWLANGPTDPLRAAADSAAGGRIALVGDTFDDVRHVMAEGPSGILAVCPPHQRPQWYRSQR
jgi:phage terminase large subunit-like protein